jgi:hypothetical protein
VLLCVDVTMDDALVQSGFVAVEGLAINTLSEMHLSTQYVPLPLP